MVNISTISNRLSKRKALSWYLAYTTGSPNWVKEKIGAIQVHINNDIDSRSRSRSSSRSREEK